MAQLEGTTNTGESDLHDGWDFAEWLKQNELTSIKAVFNDHNMNTLSSLTLNNAKFVAVITDPRVVKNPLLSGKIVQAMQELDSLRVAVKQETQDKPKVIYVSVSKKESQELTKIQKYLNAMKNMNDEWNEIGAKYNKKKLENTHSTMQHIEKQILTLNQREKMMTELFNELKQILLDKEETLKNEITQYRRILNTLLSEQNQTIEQMDILFSSTQTKICQHEKYFKKKHYNCKDIMRQYDKDDIYTCNLMIQNEEREEKIIEIGIEAQKYYENVVIDMDNNKRQIVEYTENKIDDQKEMETYAYDIPSIAAKQIYDDVIKSITFCAGVDFMNFMNLEQDINRKNKQIESLKNKNQHLKTKLKAKHQQAQQLSKIFEINTQKIASFKNKLREQSKTINKITQINAKKKFEVQMLQKSLSKNKLKEVIKQNNAEIEQLKKKQADSKWVLETHKEKLNKELKEKEELQQQALMYKNELNELNKQLLMEKKEEMAVEENKNDKENICFIHYFNRQYINQDKWRFSDKHGNANGTITAVSKDLNDYTFYFVCLFDINAAKPKAKMCRWMKSNGYCQWGDQCHFSHSRSDLYVSSNPEIPDVVYCSIKWTAGHNTFKDRAPCCIGIVDQMRTDWTQNGIDALHQWDQWTNVSYSYFEAWNHPPYWYLNETITIKMDLNLFRISYFKGNELFKMDTLPKNQKYYIMLCSSVHPKHGCEYAAVKSEKM